MVILQLVHKSLERRKTKALVALMALSCSVSLVLLLVHIKNNLSHTINRVTNQADLIVSAPAQPAYLALYGLFRIGNPPPAINVSLFETIKAHSEVMSAIPLSMQESHRGITITGTTSEFFQYFDNNQPLTFAEGEGFSQPRSIVLGATVAERTGYGIGERMTLAAGFEPALSDEYPQSFTITGILTPVNTIIDNSALVPIKTLQSIRSENTSKKADDNAINLILLKLHNRQALLPMQNQIKEFSQQPVEVIIPNQELTFIRHTGNQLVNLMLGIVAITLLMALITVFFSVSGSLAERRYEIDTLRMLGARSHQVIVIGLLEPLLIIFTASLLGFGLFWAGVKGLEYSLPDIWKGWIAGHPVSIEEVGVLLLLILAGTVLATVPAWRTYGQCTRVK